MSNKINSIKRNKNNDFYHYGTTPDGRWVRVGPRMDQIYVFSPEQQLVIRYHLEIENSDYETALKAASTRSTQAFIGSYEDFADAIMANPSFLVGDDATNWNVMAPGAKAHASEWFTRDATISYMKAAKNIIRFDTGLIMLA